MKAVVFHGVGDIRLDNVSEPHIKDANDAIVNITASAICGTDLHMIRGTLTGMKPGTILGHEGVGVVEEVGKGVRNLRKGDRIVVPSTIACGYCSYCRAGYHSQCDNANPVKPGMTAFFGGPEDAGGFHGMQAEFVRVPFANVGPVKLPEEVTDDQAILCSDIFPTGYQGAAMAQIKPGNTVAVFGCGPVGQFAIASAFMRGAGRVFAVDCIPSRLEMAQRQGAETINFNEEDPVEAIKELTGGIGADRVIDAVGVDAVAPKSGPAKKSVDTAQQKADMKKVAPKTHPEHGNWEPGDAPTLALNWLVDSVCKAGSLSIIGVYPDTVQTFPIGKAMSRNLTINMGNCNHRRYIPDLVELIREGAFNPTTILTHTGPLVGAIEAYEQFDKRQPGWVKVKLDPHAPPAKAA